MNVRYQEVCMAVILRTADVGFFSGEQAECGQ